MDVPTTSSSFFIAVHVTVRGYMRAYVCADLRGPSSFCSQKKKNQSFVSDDAKIPRSIFVTTFADVRDTKRTNL